MWNPSTCTCACDKYFGTGQYLDYDNCVCRKKLIDCLIEKCTSIADIDSYKKESSKTDVILFYLFYFCFFCVCFISCRINILLS